jgi:ABC-2 type transport system permease protein
MTALPDAPPRRSVLDFGVIAVMWRRELLRSGRDRSQLFGALSRTLLWLVILGFGLGATLREIEGYTYAQYILPGVITLNVLFASLQSAVALVWDRQVGLLREVLVSPAPMFSVALGKILGGASVAVIQGAIPLAFAPVLGLPLSAPQLVLALGVMFVMGVSFTAAGVVLASRMTTFEGFGAISNGVIQPLYFLSGAIFPLKGVIGGVGFLDLPDGLRAELRRHGIYAIGGGWMVELPSWLDALVHANPVSYLLDLLRLALLGFSQLPLSATLACAALLPLVTVALATRAMSASRGR